MIVQWVAATSAEVSRVAGHLEGVFVPIKTDPGFKHEIFSSLRTVMAAIAELLGPGCEVVLHDLENPDASIIWIEGDVTGRKVGGPLTDLGLAYLHAGETEGVHSYTTTIEGGRKVKSSSVFLTDRQGEVFAALCINYDVTPFLSFERHLQSLLTTPVEEESWETFGGDSGEVLDNMLEEVLAQIGIPISLMQRRDRLKVVRALEEKGAFLLRKAVPHVAERLGVSRHTIYNDLVEIEDN